MLNYFAAPSALRASARPCAFAASRLVAGKPLQSSSVRFFSPSSRLPTMADLKVDLTAPNGKKFTLPTGLFINNEFLKGSGGKITSINPRSVCGEASTASR